jgi:hypothetical protein
LIHRLYIIHPKEELGKGGQYRVNGWRVEAKYLYVSWPLRLRVNRWHGSDCIHPTKENKKRFFYSNKKIILTWVIVIICSYYNNFRSKKF